MQGTAVTRMEAFWQIFQDGPVPQKEEGGQINVELNAEEVKKLLNLVSYCLLASSV